MWQGVGKAWSLRGGQLGLRGETGCLHSLIIIIIDQLSNARKGGGLTQTEWHHLKTVLFSGCLHQHASCSCAAELRATRATLRLQRQPERPPNTEQTQGVRQWRQGLLTEGWSARPKAKRCRHSLIIIIVDQGSDTTATLAKTTNTDLGTSGQSARPKAKLAALMPHHISHCSNFWHHRHSCEGSGNPC